MNNRAEDIVAGRWIVLVVREWCESDLSNKTFCLRTKVSYEIQNRQVVEGIEVKQVLRVHDGKTFVVDQAAGAEDVKPKMLVGVRPALAIPLLGDGCRVAIGVEDKPVVRGRQYISQYLAAELGRYPQERWIGVQRSDGFRYGDLLLNRFPGVPVQPAHTDII